MAKGSTKSIVRLSAAGQSYMLPASLTLARVQGIWDDTGAGFLMATDASGTNVLVSYPATGAGTTAMPFEANVGVDLPESAEVFLVLGTNAVLIFE